MFFIMFSSGQTLYLFFCLKFPCVASDWRNAFELYTIFYATARNVYFAEYEVLCLYYTKLYYTYTLYTECLAFNCKDSNVIFDMRNKLDMYLHY